MGPDAGLFPLRYRTAIVVANPVSGRGRGRDAAEELAAGLRKRGVACELLLTDRRGEAFDHLRTLTQPVDLVVAVGGDGTVREILDGLVDPAVPVGVLPYGTANVLAHELDLPRDVHHALDILARDKPREIDVLSVNGRLATFVVGTGIDALAVAEVERRRTGPITKLAYASAVLRALRHYRPPELRVELDGTELPDPFGFVLVSNTRGYGSILHLAPDARMDDGLLEAYLFPTGSLFELARAFLRGLVAHLPGGAVTMRRARSIRIRSETPVPFQVDGDSGGHTPVEIAVARNRYRLLAR